MAELVPVSPLTLDLLASLAATDQLLAITDPAGTPGLGRVPLSGLDDRFALKDATNITAATWRTAVGVPEGVIHAADSTARLALTGYFNGQLVIQDDTLVTYSLLDDTDPSNAASWDDLSVGSVAWADITGVPATFAPSAHTQTAATITDFATAVGLIAQPVVGGATLNDVATFDASGFVQDSGVLISNVIVEGDARLTDARTPTAHTHPFSEVTGDIDVAQFPVGAANQFLRINLAGTAIEWVSVPGGGDLLSTNNLSDLADAATARVNLDLEIGVDVQAYDAMLDELSALVSPGADRILFWDNSTANLDWLVPSANFAITTTNLDLAATVMLKADNLSGLANTGTSRTNLGVAIGTDVQAHDVLLDSFAALADPGFDRVLFWDESAGVGGAMAWLTMGTGLTITGTTLDAAAGGTVTNTGGDLTANSVVLGAGTVDTKVVAGITTNGTAQLVLGVNATSLGSVKLFGNTSGDATISPAAVAGTATALTLPATSGTLALAGAAPAAHAATHVNGTDDIQDATAAQKGLATAAQITKLDGIEAAATADQSAAEILAALLTVDGTGSGLDADLLDGSSSAAFATAAQGALADTALQRTGLTEWDEQAGDPATPAASKWKLYFKAGGAYIIDDAAAVTGPLGTGGGAVATDAIWDAAGDLAVGTGANTAAKLTMGSALQVLRVNSAGTALEYAAPSGGSGSLTIARWDAQQGQAPASNYATFDTRNSIAVLAFNDSTDYSTVFVEVMPEGAVLTGGVAVYIHWMAASATSGAVIWEASIERSNTDLDADSFATVAFASGTANATSGIVTKTTISISSANIDGVTAGDLFRLKISRDANGTNGTDDMTGNAQLVAVELRGVA